MGFLKPSPPRIKVEVVVSTHGQSFVTWPTNMAASGSDLPALPVGHTHQRSRQWVLADKSVVLILPGDPKVHPGGVIRHTFAVVQSSWNNRTKTLSTLAVHPSDPEAQFMITTSGSGCACTQGQAGNAGPTGEPYELSMVNTNLPEFDWHTTL